MIVFSKSEEPVPIDTQEDEEEGLLLFHVWQEIHDKGTLENSSYDSHRRETVCVPSRWLREDLCEERTSRGSPMIPRK